MDTEPVRNLPKAPNCSSHTQNPTEDPEEGKCQKVFPQAKDSVKFQQQHMEKAGFSLEKKCWKCPRSRIGATWESGSVFAHSWDEP